MIVVHTVLLKSGVGDIILGAGIVAKLVLAILIVLSIISWAIAIDKFRAFRKCNRHTKKFLSMLPRDFSIFEASRHGRGFEESNLPHLMIEGATSVEKDLAAISSVEESHARMIAESAKSAMERAALNMIDGMERNLSFLATTASVSPFLGLFGTVWGVMNSFLSMGQMGSASLTVVGSGVAEALITTVFGLGAAIPALVAYNYLVNNIRRERSQMDSFISRVAESIEKEILRELNAPKVSV
ncbi:MAG: MotA/TolQ/ExbB proton channel family protein [Candidatus Eisenbacteria bacterium]